MRREWRKDLAMIVSKNVYEEILRKTPSHMPETGGIIGGQNGVYYRGEF